MAHGLQTNSGIEAPFFKGAGSLQLETTYISRRGLGATTASPTKLGDAEGRVTVAFPPLVSA